MANDDQAKRDFGINLFNQILDKFSEYPKGKKTRSYDPKKIRKEHLALLLAWPGIFTYKMVLRTNEEGLNNKIKEIQNLIVDSGEDSNDKDEQLKELIISLLYRTYFITHPNSIHFDTKLIRRLIFLLSQYFVLCCFLINILKKPEDKSPIKFITNDDIIKVINYNSVDNEIINDLTLISLWWNFQSLSYCGMIPDLICKNNANFRKQSAELEEKIKNQYFGDNKVDGVAIDLNLDETLLDYISVYAVSFDKKKEDVACSGYIFHKKIDLKESISEQLLNYLYVLVEQIGDNACELDKSLNIFIDTPEKIILPKLHDKKFRKYIDKIIESNNFLDILIHFEDLNRAILSAHVKFDGAEKEYNSVINILATAQRKKPEISKETKEKLLEANQEISDFIDIIWDGNALLNENLHLDDDGIIEYFNRQKNDYKYLKYLDGSMLSDLNLLVNKYLDKRDFSRNALPIIKNHIEGKPKANTMHKILLRQILDLE